MTTIIIGRRLAILFAAVTLLTGCYQRFEPIYNVQNHPISVPGLSSEQVAKAINIAAANQTTQRWQLTSVKPGTMRGKVTWDKFSADADILYSEKSYSIVFVDAVNLWGKDGQIHRNYNRAVQHLEDEIDHQLMVTTD